MTEEEKKAQEEAAARAAEEAAQAGGETGGEAGSQEGNNNEGTEGGESKGDGGEGGEQKPAEKLPREILFERVRTSRPDAKYDEDEEEVYRQLTAMLDEAEEGNGKYKGLTEKMMRRYKDDPEEVAALLDYMEGMPLVAAIRKHKGDEALTLQEGDEGWDEYQKAGEARKADREKYEGLMSEIEGNMGKTVESFDNWAKEHNLDEGQQEDLWKSMSADLDKMSRGIFDSEIFERYLKAANYEKDVEGAKEQGEADGKNAAIEAKKEQMKGSGLPGMASGSAKKEEVETKKGNATAEWLSGFRHK